MYNIGIDMATVSRIEKSCQKESFRNHVFTQAELDLFFNREKPKYSSLAANFAAKEAFAKALGTGIRKFGFIDIEILRDELGAPYFNFYGKVAEIVSANGYKAKVSLSHEGDTAIAMVLLEETTRMINL